LPSETSDKAPRTLIGPYEVLFELATGGMATVLLARQTGDAGFERLVALKRVHRHLVQDPEIFAMTSDEARIAALVRHPNAVAVIGVLDTGGELVLVQEYVEGFTLSALLRRLRKAGRRVPPPIAARIAADGLKGLHAAHETKDLRGEPLGIVHRDVSPQNLLVGLDGMSRIIDFGIARAERRMAMTRTGVLKGKVVYMSPEQVEEKPLDRRADLFSAGAVLYEALTGARPFAGDDDMAVITRILMSEIDMAPVAEACEPLVPVVQRALAKRPEDRFATALEMARAVSAAVALADDEEVEAFVAEVFAEDIASLRARVAEALGRADGEDHAGGPVNGPASVSTRAEGRARAPSEREPETPLTLGEERATVLPSRSQRTLLAGAAVLLIVAGTVVAVVPTSGTRPTGARPADLAPASSSAEAPASAESPPASGEPRSPGRTADPDVTFPAPPADPPAASASVARGAPAAPKPLASARASARPSATGTELHPSPYKQPSP
jgi:serine/threonine-protein kinase